MIQHEFERFLAELEGKGVRDDVKRIGNLILANIDTLVPLGTHHGQRSKAIVQIAQRGLEGASVALPVIPDKALLHEFEFKSLSHLKVGPFRGFTDPEEFNLDSRIVLLYGPNGTGKTSFCEALEYALLGEIQEAEAKRLGQAEYLENARVGSYRTPNLSAKNANGEAVELAPDAEKYRFCFVEKNRIDDFSRIAAKLPAQQNKLIATLFGLGPFDEFVKRFSTEIDETKYIDTVGVKALELTKKRDALKVDQEVIKTADAERQALSEKEQALADNKEKSASYAEFVTYLGTPETPGRIQELENLLEGDTPKQIGLSRQSLEVKRTNAVSSSNTLKTVTKEYDSKRNEVSFRDLYAAVEKLQELSQGVCPACDTPLESVVTNPFEKAEAGKKALAHLSELELTLEEAKRASNDSSLSLYTAIQGVISYANGNNQFSDEIELITKVLPANDDQLNKQWWDSLERVHSDTSDAVIDAWAVINAIADSVEKFDVEVADVIAKREAYKQELARLRGFRESVVKLDETRKILEARIEKAKLSVEQFDEQNKALIQTVEDEKPKVALNQRIVSAYRDIVAKLLEYRKSLPARLLANLGETTKSLYNGFNRSDPPGDLISDLRLPLASGNKIQVAYQSNPKKYFDALHVMSEGHIRCLGLAILLAKNIDLKCPVLLFDDPVNAIDEDHREGIRKTLFEDDYFSGTQVILTCHGEDFYKDIQNLIGREVAKKSQFYSFLPHDGDNRIKVDSAPTPRNYVVSAQEHMAKGNIRYALADARRATENLGIRIWSFLGKRDKGALSITMRGPNSKPELNNLVIQLRKKLGDNTFVHDRKDALIDGLDTLIREWEYLNKGTHDEEDRGEFDRERVRTIVDAIVHLDTTLNRRN